MEGATRSRPLEELVREHAALRRVATLVAREPPPAEVFAAVTEEAGMLLGAQRATLLRVEDEEAVVAAAWSDGTAPPLPVGHRAALDPRGLVGQMLRTARPVRIESFDELGEGAVTDLMRRLGIRCAVGGPIVLGGRVWGAVSVVWSDPVSMPPGADERVAAFAELVSQAIANAEARDELAASRARLVEAADAARQRIERDLHDGAQQRFVATRLELTVLARQLERDPEAAKVALARAREQLDDGLRELRDLARGIHPAVLTDRGLEPALAAVVQRAPTPVELRVTVPDRPDPAIEAAAYFVVSEALTNVAKYAQADTAIVEVTSTGGTLNVTIGDDGVGGADPTRGSGLRGLIDRVEAVGGHLNVSSPPGQGTRLCARLPIEVLGAVGTSRR